MSADLANALMPAIAVLCTFGMPVAIVFVIKHFKFKQRELDLEGELQKQWTAEQRRQLETRIAALEGTVQAVLQLVSRPIAAPPAPGVSAPVQSATAPLSPMQQLAAVAEPPPAPEAQRAPAPGQRERG